jgi:phage baseplate assembly protein W
MIAHIARDVMFWAGVVALTVAILDSLRDILRTPLPESVRRRRGES